MIQIFDSWAGLLDEKNMSDYIYVLKDGVIYDEFGNLHNSNNLKPYTRQLISNSF